LDGAERIAGNLGLLFLAQSVKQAAFPHIRQTDNSNTQVHYKNCTSEWERRQRLVFWFAARYGFIGEFVIFSFIPDSLCLRLPVFSLAICRELRQNNGRFNKS
jgi:hypothetical protein